MDPRSGVRRSRRSPNDPLFFGTTRQRFAVNAELTRKLIKRFPVLYQGVCEFECGDGWFEILWQLSLALEAELGDSPLKRRWLLLKKHLADRWNSAIYALSPPKTNDWLARLRTRLAGPGRWGRVGLKRLVWWPNTGFAVTQVKEKYGTLRYYTGWSTPEMERYMLYARHLSAH